MRIHFDNLQAVQSFFEENDPVGIQEIVFLVSEKSSAKKTLQCFYGLIHSLCRRKKSDFVNVHIAARSAGEFPGAVHSSLIGMAESMDLEFKKIGIDCVVYDSQADYDSLVSLIYNRNKPLLTLMTRNKLRRPMIEKIPAKDAGEFSLSNGGTYVITGGAGGIALEIADRFLDLNSGINLVLLARSVRTDASGWEDLARNGADSKTRGKYRKLLGLQKKADSVAVYNCDVSNAEEARDIFKRICKRYGKINGLIHAAGIAGGGFAARKEWDEYIDVLNPKLDGTDNILQFACANPMEFVWLFSSYSTVFPTAGQSDYIAANAYMDGIVNEERYPSNIKVINWSGWRETGMAFENHVEEKDSPVDFLGSEEGVRSLLKAAVFCEKRILIGKLNTAGLASGFDEQKKYIELDKELTNEIKRAAQKNGHREIEAAKIDVVVHGKESGVLTPTEQKIAQAWARILGLREIYYYDKFLEIGGDSLSATYLQKEIDKYFPGAMDITDVFVYPSIYEMAKYIDQTVSRHSETGQEADDIKSLLDKLYAGEIDVSDAEKML